MTTYTLHQRPVSGHNHCEGIAVEVEPMSPNAGRVVRMRCCYCCRDEQLEKGTVLSLPPGTNWKRASAFSMGEDATMIKPRELIPQGSHDGQADDQP